jgi:hypothetical protein
VPPEPLPAATVTVTWVLPATPVGVAGVFGATATVTELVADEAADVPMLFVAVTVNVYAVPVVNPETVIPLLHVAEVKVPVLLPGLDVAV